MTKICVIMFKRVSDDEWENGIAFCKAGDPIEILDKEGKPIGKKLWTYLLLPDDGCFLVEL